MLVALGVLGVLVLALWLGQRRLVYLADRSPVPPMDELVPGARDLALETADGLVLTAGYVPPRRGCDATVLVAPGNGGNRGGRVDLARALADRGLGVLLMDYRGYGGNPGSPSEEGLALDARAARAALDALGHAHVVYLGESLGTGVVTELAIEHPPTAMVLRSPFTSLADAGRASYRVPVGWLLRDTFPVLENVAATRWPTAVVHGSRDTIVPADQSRRVADAVRATGASLLEVEVPGADHNDAVLVQGRELVTAVVDVAARGGAAGCG